MSVPFRGPSAAPPPAAGAGAMRSVLDARILVVDDEPANVLLLERILRAAGYAGVRCTTDSREALPLVREFDPDLILLDLHMPHVDGIEVIADVREEAAPGAYLPILVLSADTLQTARNSVLQFGAQDFLAKPFDRGEVLLRVGNLLHTRALHLALQGQNERLEARVRHRTRELEEALDAARAAARAKEQFLANIGHELRTPLTAVHAAVQLLRRLLGDEIPPQATRMLVMAAANSERLARVVEDILMVQRVRGGVLEPSVAAVSVETMIHEVVEAVSRARPPAAGVALRAQVAGGLPPVRTDGDKLRDILRRLVENACRFTPGGSITVAARRGERPYAVRLEVADTGVGIPKDQLDALFEPFEQADNSDTRRHGGVGLGLTIVRGLCEVIGARLEVHSTPGEGSTFSVLLPGAVPGTES